MLGHHFDDTVGTNHVEPALVLVGKFESPFALDSHAHLMFVSHLCSGQIRQSGALTRSIDVWHCCCRTFRLVQYFGIQEQNIRIAEDRPILVAVALERNGREILGYIPAVNHLSAVVGIIQSNRGIAARICRRVHRYEIVGGIVVAATVAVDNAGAALQRSKPVAERRAQTQTARGVTDGEDNLGVQLVVDIEHGGIRRLQAESAVGDDIRKQVACVLIVQALCHPNLGKQALSRPLRDASALIGRVGGGKVGYGKIQIGGDELIYRFNRTALVVESRYGIQPAIDDEHRSEQPDEIEVMVCADEPCLRLILRAQVSIGSGVQVHKYDIAASNVVIHSPPVVIYVLAGSRGARLVEVKLHGPVGRGGGGGVQTGVVGT